MVERAFRIKIERTDEYLITTEPGLLADVGVRLRSLAPDADSAVIVCDRSVHSLYANDLGVSLSAGGFSSLGPTGFANDAFVVSPGEKAKSTESSIRLWDKLAEHGFLRRSVLVALGGGVITDLTGFVAASFMRGVPYVNLPTTLVGQLDAAVGSKVAVNHSRAKNLIGFFHHPLAVYNDPNLLSTLPQHEVRQGLAEAIKTAVIGSLELFEFLEANITTLLGKHIATLTDLIASCVRVKCRLLLMNFYEKELRRGLNFGHMIGHALETATGYNRLSHGDAVSIGMATAVRLAHARRLLDKGTEERIVRLLDHAGLPTSARMLDVSVEHIWEAVSAVRSIRNGHLYEVLPKAIGQFEFTDHLSLAELRECL